MGSGRGSSSTCDLGLRAAVRARLTDVFTVLARNRVLISHARADRSLARVCSSGSRRAIVMRGSAMVSLALKAVLPIRAGALTPRLVSSLSDKERAEERVFFNKKDEEALRKLLGKMKTQADASAGDGGAEERRALDAIVKKYAMSDADVDALIQWRHREDI